MDEPRGLQRTSPHRGAGHRPLLGRARSIPYWLQLDSFGTEALCLIRQRRNPLCNDTTDIPKQLQDMLRRAEYNKPDCYVSPLKALEISADELNIGLFAATMAFQEESPLRLGISRMQKLFPVVCSGHMDVYHVLSIMYLRCFQNDGLVAELDEASKQARSARALASGENRAITFSPCYERTETTRS